MQAEAMETEPIQTDADTKKEEGDNGVKKEEADNGAEQQPEQQPDQQQPDTTPQQEGEKDSGEKQEQQEPENMDVCSSSCNLFACYHICIFIRASLLQVRLILSNLTSQNRQQKLRNQLAKSQRKCTTMLTYQ